MDLKKVIDNLISNALKYNINENPIVEIKYKDNIFSVFNTGEKIDTKNLLLFLINIFRKTLQKMVLDLVLLL